MGDPMASEFQLNLDPRVEPAGPGFRVRSQGGVVSAISDRTKRNKWMDILCVLPDPRPRRTRGGATLPSHREVYETATTPIQDSLGAIWTLAKEHWTPALRSAWNDWQKTPKGSEHDGKRAGLIQTIEGGGIRSAMGREPLGQVDLLDTWLWSEWERRNTYIVVSEAIPEAMGDEMGRPAVEIENGRNIYRVSSYVDWETDLGLSSDLLARIRDNQETVHPDFSAPLALAKFRNTVDEPEVVRVRQAVRLGETPIREVLG